jgi:hypothetical protein
MGKNNQISGDWALALGAATASGTWEGFRLSPVRPTAELRVNGALQVGETERAHYALVVANGDGRERVLVAGNGGTIEFGHDFVELLHLEPPAGALASMWLTDLSTGAESSRCALPRFAAHSA